MGGKILQLESERLREEGQKTERVRAIQNMIKYDVSKEKNSSGLFRRRI